MKKSLIVFVISYMSLIICFGCVGRERPDDIVLIKNLLEDFSYGINERDVPLLDSLYWGNKEERTSAIRKLLEDLSNLGEIKNLGFLGKRIEIFGKDATVNMTLKGEKIVESRPIEFNVPLELKLVKKRGAWRIVGHKFL